MDSNNINTYLEDLKVRQPGFTCNEEAIRSEANSGLAIFSNLGIKLLSVFGGLLGTLSFMIFIGAAVFDSPIASLIGGALFIFIAVIIGKTSESILADTSLLCMCLAGFVLMGIGLERKADDNTMAFIILVVALLVMWFSRGFMMNFVSVLIANGSLFSFLVINEAGYFYHVYYGYVVFTLLLLTHHEAKIIASGQKVNRLYAPLRSAFLLTSIAVLAFSNAIFSDDKIPNKWISSVIAFAGILLIVSYIIKSLQSSDKRTMLFLYGLTILIFLPSIFAPAILGSLLILILSYHYGHRSGFWAALLSLFYSVSQYYYDLNLNLLVKSEIMLLSGALFLAAFFLLKKHLLSK